MAYTPCRYAQRWPDLFEPLDDEQRRAVSQALANSRLEGDDPSRQDVADLVDFTAGKLTFDEYMARTAPAAPVGT